MVVLSKKIPAYGRFGVPLDFERRSPASSLR
jgi:hypothetical protein